MTFDEAQAVVRDIRYKDYSIELGECAFTAHNESCMVTITCRAPNALDEPYYASKEGPVCGREWVCLPSMTPERLVDVVFKGCERLELHECAEWFRYKGEMIYDPHKTHASPAPMPAPPADGMIPARHDATSHNSHLCLRLWADVARAFGITQYLRQRRARKGRASAG